MWHISITLYVIFDRRIKDKNTTRRNILAVLLFPIIRTRFVYDKTCKIIFIIDIIAVLDTYR